MVEDLEDERDRLWRGYGLILYLFVRALFRVMISFSPSPCSPLSSGMEAIGRLAYPEWRDIQEAK
ncbi:hypothetical protein BDZ91DRAFT_709044 [Kalaharituber pfeilii]|nr:hypothetical protein BDZ91DRAFT_709044 [Kalaharituber pfeilii]